VCIENFIRFDCAKDSHNVRGYDCATLLLPGAMATSTGGRLAFLALLPGVCTKNPIRIDCLTESPKPQQR
jgi:hypothetical protein